MGILDKFKKKKPSASSGPSEAKTEKKKAEEKMPEVKAEAKKPEAKESTASLYGKKEKSTGKKKVNRSYRLLLKPVVSEKASYLGMYGQYVFKVAGNANKIEIKKAINSLYNVDVEKVRIVTVGGKQVRYGKVRGETSSWKKAIVTLKAGQKLELYEGV